MKKTRATALLLASVMTLTSVPCNVMADASSVSDSSVAAVSDTVTSGSSAKLTAMSLDGWTSGWTGATDQAKNVKVEPTDDGVRLYMTKAGNGKINGDEDSIAYYTYAVPATADFKLSATVTVDGYNSLGKSNPQQSGFGMMILNELYSKGADDTVYTNNVMLSSYMTKSSATEASISAMHRYNGVRTVDESLVTGLATSTLNDKIGPFEMSVVKSGNSVKVSVDGKEYSYDVEDLATNPTQAYFDGNIYPGFFIARDADVTFSNVNFELETRTVESLEIVSMPDKLDYVVDDELDLSGLQLKATFTDGTSEIISDYSVKGFDSSTKGNKTLRIIKGSQSVEIPYTVSPVMCTKLNITTAPVYSEFYLGQRFSTEAFEAEAEYNSGNKATISADDCLFFMDGKQIDESYEFTKADVGTKTITVRHATTDSVETSSTSDSFKITVEDYSISAIMLGTLPTRTSYALNDEIDTTGLTIRGVYTNDAGESKFALLNDDEYEVLSADTSSLGTATVTVRYAKNPSLTTTFNISVVNKIALSFTLQHYPRTTYQIGEDFTTEGMKAAILYNTDESELTDAYTVDLSEFDNSKVGTTKVTIVPNDTESFNPIELDVTITAEKTYYWKSTAFGASATYNLNTAKETYDEDGNVESVQVRSWNGAGKITGDHDGISYYYTRVDADKNFTISADILVNDYLEHDNSDEQRSGQEAFGIMARDTIPLNPDMDKLEDAEIQDIEDALAAQEKAGTSNYIPMTNVASKAELDENGEPVPAYSNGKNYKVTFSSNMVILGGYSGTSWPTDTAALSYQKNATINRINLVMRSGVYNADGSNSVISKSGPYKLSDTFPARGNRYRVTLTKINGGIYAKCYDYTTGVEKETYQYAEDDEELANLFTRQDPDNIYVGFFAARWADITVSDFEIHETNPDTDPITTNGTESATTPAIKLQSSAYSTITNYNLSLKATNSLGGTVTIQQNGKIVYRDEPISKSSYLPVTLEANSVNEFTVLYKPNASDNITSTDSVTINFTVTHRDSLGDYDVLYCSPDGSVKGDGTRENPLDIYSAVGFVDLGKEVVALDGTYKMTKNFEIPLTNTGVAKAWKTLRADDGATVTLDMQGKYEGITLDGYYWLLKGIDFTNSGNNLKPFLLAGNHCILEDCKFYGNGDTGFQMSRSSDSNINIDMWPSYNVIRDCESYNNCDPSMINADGFGLKLTVGYGNIFERCVSHNNVDDGYDAYTKKGEGIIGPVTLVSCVSYDNGNRLNADGSTTAYGAGGHNGFKMGGESIAVQHYLKDCISFENDANGITTNTNPALKLRNFISYKNSGRGIYLYTGDGQRNFNYDLKGCVSYKNGSEDSVAPQDIDTYVESKIASLETATKQVKIPEVLTAYADASLVADFVAAGGVIDDSESGNVWPLGVNHSTTPINNSTNYWNGENCDGDVVTDDFFKSVDKNDSLTNGKYSQDSEGQFIFGDFLARATAYVHDAEDEVVFPDGPQTLVDETTEATTAATTETTTKATSSSSSSSSSSGGGSGSSSHKASGEATTKVVEEAATERTTTAPAKSFVAPSGVVITPPVNSGVRVSFTDISNRAWAVDSINKLAAAGIVSGVSSDKFAPDAYSKRADFVVMLVKTFGLAGTATDNFDDVQSGKYYANAVGLAKQAGITNGYGDGNFGPENTITRQDMMVLVAKALEFAGLDLDSSTSVLDKFADKAQIADYAKPYVAALVNAGLANGTDTGIEPLAQITRAQMSVLIANVYDVVLDMANAYEAEADEEIVADETEAEVADNATEVESTDDSAEATTEAE